MELLLEVLTPRSGTYDLCVPHPLSATQSDVLSTATSMPAPYRDENESLRNENEQLRGKLGKPLARRLWTGLALVGLDFGAVMLLLPWLNGTDDVKFWAGLAIIAAIAVAATVSVVRR